MGCRTALQSKERFNSICLQTVCKPGPEKIPTGGKLALFRSSGVALQPASFSTNNSAVAFDKVGKYEKKNADTAMRIRSQFESTPNLQKDAQAGHKMLKNG